VTLICAKFGKDLFNISKVIGRKTKWPRFLAYPVYSAHHAVIFAIAKRSCLVNDRCLPCYSNRGLWNQWKNCVH